MTTGQEIEKVKAPQEYLPENQIKEINSSLEEAKQKAVSIRVVNDDSANEANALCGTWKAKQKGIEKFRLAIVGPLKEHIASIDTFFKGLSTGYDEPLAVVEDKVLKHREKKIEAERKERERLEREAREKEEKEKAKLRAQQEEARKKEEAARASGRAAEAERLAAEQAKLAKQEAEVKVEVKEPTKAAPAKSSYQEGVGMTTFIKTAEHRIENPDLVPDEFWIIDEKKLGARVRELTKDLEVGKVYRDKVAGVVITCTERMSNKADR